MEKDLERLKEIETQYWKLMENYNACEQFDYLARLTRKLLEISNRLAEKAWMYEDTSK